MIFDLVSKCFLLLFSEYRFTNLSFLTSINYMVILVSTLVIFLVIEFYVYQFPMIIYGPCMSFLAIQVYTFLCRIYLWCGDSTISIMVHRGHAYLPDEDYKPSSIYLTDFYIVGLMCLYVYISKDLLEYW